MSPLDNTMEGLKKFHGPRIRLALPEPIEPLSGVRDNIPLAVPGPLIPSGPGTASKNRLARTCTVGYLVTQTMLRSKGLALALTGL